MNFVASPIQSAALIAQAIPPPLPIDDAAALAAAGQPLATKHARRSAGGEYKNIVMTKLKSGDATSEDLYEAKLYEQGIYMAELLPSVQRSMPGFNALQVALALQPHFTLINARLDQMNARLDQTAVRQSNLFVERDDDAITPMVALPVLPQIGLPMVGPAPVPAVFPNTKRDLYVLPAPALNQLFAYYSLVAPAGAHLETRRRRLAAHLGLPLNR